MEDYQYLTPQGRVRIIALQYDLPGMIECVLGMLGPDIVKWIQNNVEAVIGHYKTTGSSFSSGHQAVWYAGELVQDFGQVDFRDQNQDMENLQEWREEYGPGIMWIERPIDVCPRISAMLAESKTNLPLCRRILPRLKVRKSWFICLCPMELWPPIT